MMLIGRHALFSLRRSLRFAIFSHRRENALGAKVKIRNQRVELHQGTPRIPRRTNEILINYHFDLES